MFCDNCGSQLPSGVRFCSNCGKEFPENQINRATQQAPNVNVGQPQTFTGYTQQGAYPPPAAPMQQYGTPNGFNHNLVKARSFADGIKTYDVITSIAWIFIGALQIFTVFGGAELTYLIIGIWNIVNAVKCIASSKNIVAGNSSVTDAFTVRMVTSVITFIAMIYIGAWLACLLAVADFIVAIVVTNNSQYFNPNILKER